MELCPPAPPLAPLFVVSRRGGQDNITQETLERQRSWIRINYHYGFQSYKYGFIYLWIALVCFAFCLSLPPSLSGRVRWACEREATPRASEGMRERAATALSPPSSSPGKVGTPPHYRVISYLSRYDLVQFVPQNTQRRYM